MSNPKPTKPDHAAPTTPAATAATAAAAAPVTTAVEAPPKAQEKKADDELATLRSELALLKAKYNPLAGKLESLEEQLASANADAEALKVTHAEDLKAMTAETERVRAQLTESQALVAELTNKLDHAVSTGMQPGQKMECVGWDARGKLSYMVGSQEVHIEPNKPCIPPPGAADIERFKKSGTIEPRFAVITPKDPKAKGKHADAA